MKRISLYLLAVFSAAIIGTVAIQSHPAAAACTEPSPIGFVAWYHGLTDSGGCNIKNPSTVSGGLSGFVWTIVLNLLDDFLRVVGWASLIFIIFGGFKYMTSKGSSDGMAKAKNTILNAVIGLVISIVSVTVVSLVTGAFQ